MKVANLVGERFRENPSEAVLESHALLLRGGYMKGVANGIYTSYPPLRRIVRKLEGIIREEMEKLGGQEGSSRWRCPPLCGRNPGGMKAWEKNSFAFRIGTAALLCWG